MSVSDFIYILRGKYTWIPMMFVLSYIALVYWTIGIAPLLIKNDIIRFISFWIGIFLPLRIASLIVNPEGRTA